MKALLAILLTGGIAYFLYWNKNRKEVKKPAVKKSTTKWTPTPTPAKTPVPKKDIPELTFEKEQKRKDLL